MMKSAYILVGSVLVIIVGVGLYLTGVTPMTSPQNNTSKNVEMLSTGTTTLVMSEPVSYSEGAAGFFVRPETPGVYPGVVMIHEWWGLNDNIKKMAEELAAEGYLVLAVDLYHGVVADVPDDARAAMAALDQGEATQNLKDAVEFLRSQGAGKVASLGWCFGGGQSLQLSLSGTPLDGTVIYYGSLVTDSEKLASITWPVLGIFGGADTSIPQEQVEAFDAALTENGTEHSITIYPGVGHAFANPSGANYAPEETQDAWAKTLAFLSATLR